MVWKSFDQHLVGKVIYPFNKVVPHALKLKVGDTMVITSQCEDWYYGYCILKSTTQSKSGIFPVNHIKVIGKDLSFLTERRSSIEYSTDEIKSAMMTTISIQTSLILSYLCELAGENDNSKFIECETYFNKVIELAYEIANWSTNRDELIKFENQLLYINKINSILKCDAIVRYKPFTLTSVVNQPMVDLENIYAVDYQFSSDQKLQANDASSLSNPSNNCLQIVIENFEFIGYNDEFLLQWTVIDILSDINHESFWQPIKEVKKGRPSWMGEKFVFADISEEMIKDNVYLVIYVYRMGQLLPDPNKQLTIKFRRPLAFGSCCLKDLLSSTEKTTITLNCFNEADFLKTTKEMLRLKCTTPAQYRLVQISPTMIDHSRIEFEVNEKNHILRSIVLKSDKPYEYDRNFLYLMLESAEFEKASKATPRNVETQIFIVNSNGEKMPCISNNPERENKTEFYSYVIYHSNSPRWREIININLSELNPDECHILINFHHCSTRDKKVDERKYFACCFLKLSEFLDSGCAKKSYTLNTQKLSESVRQNPKMYLVKNVNSQPDLDKSKEYCKIQLFLCSTHVSNNRSINNFLNLKLNEDPSVLFIRECLKEIQCIKNEDFLKPHLRREIMSGLQILIINKVYKYYTQVELDLFITWQVLSHKFMQFQLTVELATYLRGNYSFLERLVRGIQYVLDAVLRSDISFDVLNIVLSSLQPLCEVLSTITETDYQYEVSERLKEILRTFLSFFDGHYTPESSNDIRTLVLKFAIDNFKYIYKLLSIDVVIDFFVSLFESKDFKNGKILAKEKLEFFNKILSSNIYIDCFDLLVIWFLPTIDVCLVHIDNSSPHLLLATEVMLNLFKQCKILSKEDRVDLVSQPVMKTVFTQSFNVFTMKYYYDLEKHKYNAMVDDRSNPPNSPKTNKSKTIEVKFPSESLKLYTLLVAYLEEWVEICHDDISLKDYAIMLENMRLILERNIYPKQWLSMHLKVSNICGLTLKKIARCFGNKNEQAYDYITLSYFEACFSFIMQNSLQLQNFPFAKSQAILEKYGDMRVDIMDCFLNVWKNKPSKLECFNKDFIVQVTRKVLNISFIAVSGIRYKTMPLLVHTITNWLDRCGDINEVLNDLISETELLLRDGRCDETYHETLIQILNLKRMPIDVEVIIERFAMIINLHLEYRKIHSTSNNLLHTQFLLYAFMKFYQEKVGIFTHFQHYSNKFSQMLESEEHYFEAALVLKQQYDCIHWESEKVTFDDVFYKNYDGIGNEQLKEQLGKRIIDLLNQAKEYEYAAELCQELQGHYLNEYKYKELNPLLQQWARYLDLIMTEQRLMLNYYRVTFIGGTLPSYMEQSRDYIVKGSIWFKTVTLTNMLQSAFPGAKIKAYQSSPPTESQTDQAMTIYLAKMEPVPSDVDFTKNSKISIKIRSFYKDHKINCFFSDHPYHKGVIDKNNEVKSLHVSKVIVWTNMMMPNEFMWNPIIEEDREIFTPIDVAIETVEKKNTVIKEMIDEIVENPLKDMRPFTMLLTGTLDAGVNGGMPKYIEAFFGEMSDVNKDIHVDRLNDFRKVLFEQKDVLTEALALHKQLAPPAILPMHERLEECFGYLKKSIIDLDVARKRSFSHMRNLDDIYAHIHELMVKGSSEIEDAFMPEKDKVHIRNPNNSLFPSYNDDARISSSCSSPRRTQLSSTTRSLCNSQSDIELDKSSLTTLPPIRRKVSSTDEEMLDKMAKQYLTTQKSLMTSAVSSPDIRPLTMCMSVDESKTIPLKSPPLPPKNVTLSDTNEDSVNTGHSKSMRPSIWKTLISRGKEVKSNNGKYTLEVKGKSKLHMADIF